MPLQHRAVVAPGEIARHAQADTVAGQQFDQPQAVEPRQQQHRLGLGQPEFAADLRRVPVVAQQVEHGEQHRVVGQRALLRQAELALLHRRLAAPAAHQFVNVHPEELADRVEPLQGDAAAREQALDAGLGQADGPGEIGVV